MTMPVEPVTPFWIGLLIQIVVGIGIPWLVDSLTYRIAPVGGAVGAAATTWALALCGIGNIFVPIALSAGWLIAYLIGLVSKEPEATKSP